MRHRYTAAVITLAELARLHEAYGADLAAPIAPVVIGDLEIGDAGPTVMGTVNLSRDSTYRESIATSTESAIRKGRVQVAQGARVIDLGAESTTAAAQRVGAQEQIDRVVPVIEALAPEVVVSIETYLPEVVAKGLAAGARILNLTGREHEDEMLGLAAKHGAAVVMCYVPQDTVRDNVDAPGPDRAVADLLDHFGPRLEHARGLGVEQVVIDPGLGFYYGNLTDPATRVRHQTRVLAECFRLRTLGVPIGNALPHAFDLFEDEYRKAEGFFAVLASLGGTHLFRTHEVPHVSAVLGAMQFLDL
jgi:dihydropteroate synthase